jgi:hypothetical protein
MDTFEIDPALFSRPNAGDEQLFVVFYMGTLKNESRSLEEGRLIVDDVEAVRIMVPGDKTSVIDRPATPTDKARFARQYALFRQGKIGEEQVSGTRLKDWPFVSRAQVEELNYLGIKTVEQMANASDAINFPGLQALKTHARSWLATAKDSAIAAQQADLINQQNAKIEELQMAVAEQAERIKSFATAKR